MKFGELKTRIRDLGFVGNADIDDNINLLISSLNSAIKTINNSVMSITGSYVVTINDNQSNIVKINLEEVTKVSGEIMFDKLDGTPIIETASGIYNFTNFKLIDDKIVAFAPRNGEITFFYKKRVPYIDSNFGDDSELPIKYKVEELLPFLTSYYMWLDDDIEIASRWKNEYEDLKNNILSEEKQVKAVVRTDLWQR